MPSAQETIDIFNTTHTSLHQKFEELFWKVKMGEHDLSDEQDRAEKERDAFAADSTNLEQVTSLLGTDDLTDEERKSLTIWKNFFELYQTPLSLVPLRDKIAQLESKIETMFGTRAEGYIDPGTSGFVEASENKMRMIVRTHDDELMRKACWVATQELAKQALPDFIELVTLRNEYAQGLGFEDFYSYKVHINEGMTKQQVRDLFGKIYTDTLTTFEDIRGLEKEKPGLRRPWNFGYMMAGDFTKEEDQYFDFKDALMNWGKSFAALGINYQGGTLQLDLLDRRGKYSNGFCHYPKLVNFNEGPRMSGAANFTCNVVYGQVGAGSTGMETLFHEGGHAADRLCSEQKETCLNSEYPPASVAWAETHSQFLDTMFSSIEWRTRYAKDSSGNAYPFDLFERKVRRLRIMSPHALHSIMMVTEFEQEVYAMSDITQEKVLQLACAMTKKYYDFSEESVAVLGIPHIYSWNSSGYYQGYGLAELALMQWRKYFYDKYGYIVDNPEVGREMIEVWKLGSLHPFAQFVRIATGKDLSPDAFIEDVTLDTEAYLMRAKERIKKVQSIPEYNDPINLNAQIQMVHGKELVADNKKSFEDMAKAYASWLETQRQDS